MYAIIRIRGTVNVKKGVKDALKMLRLTRVNHCVLVTKDPTFDGMLKKVREYVTWGEVSQDMLEKLIWKRGSIKGREIDQRMAKEIAKDMKKSGVNPVFRLSPPSGGYKAIKLLYPRGDLGYRGGKINNLLKRMI